MPSDTPVDATLSATGRSGSIPTPSGLGATRRGHDLDAHVLDLAVYEIGNVLVRTLRWGADQVAGQLDDLIAIVGSPLVMSRDWLPEAARLADTHGVSFYDASWAAAADRLGIPLVSADRQLLSAGLAESASEVASKMHLVSPGSSLGSAGIETPAGKRDGGPGT